MRSLARKSGGHELVKGSLHDGVTLPRATFDEVGAVRTDLCDATDAAVCRMYQSGCEVWRRPGGRTPAKVYGRPQRPDRADHTDTAVGSSCAAGDVSDFPVAICSSCYFPRQRFLLDDHGLSAIGSGTRPGSVVVSRSGHVLPAAFEAAYRFRQPIESAMMHPFGIIVLLAIQWYALAICRSWDVLTSGRDENTLQKSEKFRPFRKQFGIAIVISLDPTHNSDSSRSRKIAKLGHLDALNINRAGQDERAQIFRSDVVF